MIRLHGTCVALGDEGVLLRGPSGAGKSDLALRLIEAGGRLVADDQVEITCRDGRLIASAPAVLAGLLEVRGVGILRFPACPETRLALVVELVAAAAVERLPDPRRTALAGLDLPLIALNAFEASAPAKVRLALGVAGGNIMSL